ncbi:MAG TPA: MBL fold metallo-hydrolase [Thermomicrobiales bacterium]|nr:MBL fold metallo-hydrolase [Thermomicrobiales bacterium]
MSTSLTFLGVAGYDIAGPRHRLLIDPCLSGNPAAPCGPDDLATPDVILVSHAAFDHLGDTAAIARRTGAPVVCGGEVRALLLEQGLPSDQVRATTWGIVVEVGGVLVRPVECHHWSQARLADGSYVSGVPMGFIVETERGVVIYHYGDTAIFSDLRLIGELYRPTVGLLGCSQPRALADATPGPGRLVTGELSPREAALAAEMLGVRLAVACHYLDADDPEVAEFMALVPAYDTSGARAVVAPAPGETLVVDGATHRIVPPSLVAQ